MKSLAISTLEGNQTLTQRLKARRRGAKWLKVTSLKGRNLSVSKNVWRKN